MGPELKEGNVSIYVEAESFQNSGAINEIKHALRRAMSDIGVTNLVFNDTGSNTFIANGKVGLLEKDIERVKSAIETAIGEIANIRSFEVSVSIKEQS